MRLNKIFKSHISNALKSAEVLKVFSHLYLGVRSLVVSPYKFGLVFFYFNVDWSILWCLGVV